MACLTDADVQAVADGEAPDALGTHAAACASCRGRVDLRRIEMTELVAAAGRASPPPRLEARVREAARSAPRGATALREVRGRAIGARAIAALATAAATGAVVFLVLPRFGAPTRLSAAEVLGRSLQTLSNARGVERLEYELAFAGFGDGPHRIEQLVDHDRPTRYRIANYRADGTLESAISQDPAVGRRWHLIRVDGRSYIFELAAGRTPFLSLPELAEAQVEAIIGMMEATANQNLSIVDTAEGRQYVVQMPAAPPHATKALLDLYQARAVIDANDFHIAEFSATGTLLRQPYAVTFKLIRRTLQPAAGVAPGAFALEPGPDDVVLHGEATNDPLFDVLGTVLREVGRTKDR